jgi:hypothetical protein
MHTHPADPRNRLTLRHTHDIAAAAARVFPLLCPVREYEWIPGWSCELVHTGSGVVEPGCVFITDHTPEGRTTWVTSRHDPAELRVEFVRFTPERLVTSMALLVEPTGPERSRLHLTYELTALDGTGRDWVQRARETGAPYAAIAEGLARLLEHFLVHGEMLRQPATPLR